TTPNTNLNRGTPSPDPTTPAPPPVAAKMKAGSAVQQGIAEVSAQGDSLTQMTLTVKSTANTTIVLPVGTLFPSSSSDTQNMISAGSVAFVFTNASVDTPQVITQ